MPPLFTIYVLTGQFAYCSFFHLSCLYLGISRATCHCRCHFFSRSRASRSPFGWGCLCSLSHSLSSLHYTCFRVFLGGDWLEQRLDFTRNSIVYLFRTTYTPADSLTIAALVAYMNAALPPDKHEEFDTAEVTRAAKTLHDHGSVAFEGDMLKVSPPPFLLCSLFHNYSPSPFSPQNHIVPCLLCLFFII